MSVIEKTVSVSENMEMCDSATLIYIVVVKSLREYIYSGILMVHAESTVVLTFHPNSLTLKLILCKVF